jgi:hypothetical protein
VPFIRIFAVVLVVPVKVRAELPVTPTDDPP